MRSRSTSFFNKRPEISSQKAGRLTVPDHSETSEPELPIVPLKKAYSLGDARDLFQEFGPLVFETKNRKDFSGDFNRKLKTSTSLATDSTTMSYSPDKVDFSTLILDDYFDSSEKERDEKFFRGMVVGVRGAGKHTLLERMFNQEGRCVTLKKQPFDLVTKVIEKFDLIERYHFWLKEPAREKNKSDILLDVYYRTCSMFFFVYEPSNKSSFDSLEEELEHVSNINRNKEVFIVLVGNKRRGKTSEVTYNEICTLKKKYNIKIALEVDFSQQIPSELRGFIENFSKIIKPCKEL